MIFCFFLAFVIFSGATKQLYLGIPSALGAKPFTYDIS